MYLLRGTQFQLPNTFIDILHYTIPLKTARAEALPGIMTPLLRLTAPHQSPGE